MKTSRVTRRVVRRWLSRVRRFESADHVSLLRLAMPERERRVLGAMIARENMRRIREVARHAGARADALAAGRDYQCRPGCVCESW